MNNALLKLAITDKSYPRQVAEILAGQSWSQGCVIQVVDGIRCVELGKRGDANPPESVLQQSLESTEIVGNDGWLSFSQSNASLESPEQYCISIQVTDTEIGLKEIGEIFPALLSGIIQWHSYQQLQDRSLQTETILKIAAQWHGIKQTDQLILEIVEASTRLLGAERASLFLWDKKNEQLEK